MPKVDYQKEIWKQGCPRPGCGPKGKGKLLSIARVKREGNMAHAEVMCLACDSHMMLHFAVTS